MIVPRTPSDFVPRSHSTLEPEGRKPDKSGFQSLFKKSKKKKKEKVEHDCSATES